MPKAVWPSRERRPSDEPSFTMPVAAASPACRAAACSASGFAGALAAAFPRSPPYEPGYEAMLVNCIDPRFTTMHLGLHGRATAGRTSTASSIIAGGPDRLRRAGLRRLAQGLLGQPRHHRSSCTKSNVSSASPIATAAPPSWPTASASSTDRAFETAKLIEALRPFRAEVGQAPARPRRRYSASWISTARSRSSPDGEWCKLPVVPDSALSLPAKSASALERQLAVQRARRPADPLLSLVVPVFNEEESIDLFLTSVEPFLERAGLRFEIVFVNDGSRDDTLAHLLDCSARDRRIRVVNLSRNFGKEAALTAGIDHAKGDILIPMDIDLQDPPELIGPFIERWREGYDIVYGVRSARDLGHRGQAPVGQLVLLGVQLDVAGAHPGQCRRLPPGRPARHRGAAPAARAQPLHEGPVRLGRLQRDRRALRAAAARRGLEQVQPVAAVELRARRRGELLDRAAAGLVLWRAGDRRRSPCSTPCSSSPAC